MLEMKGILVWFIFFLDSKFIAHPHLFFDKVRLGERLINIFREISANSLMGERLLDCRNFKLFEKEWKIGTTRAWVCFCMLLVWLFDISVILLLQEGKALKQLATAARLDIEDFLQKKVFLEVPTDLCTQIAI